MGVSLTHSIPGMNLFPEVLCYRRRLQGRYSKGGIGQVRGPVNEVEVVFRLRLELIIGAVAREPVVEIKF